MRYKEVAFLKTNHLRGKKIRERNTTIGKITKRRTYASVCEDILLDEQLSNDFAPHYEDDNYRNGKD